MGALFFLILLFFAFLASPALAADAVELGSVTVNAQSFGAGTSVERFSRPEFDQTSEADVADFLRRSPAINVVTGRRGESLIQLNGFDQSQIVVLIDGAPVEIPFDGAIDLGKMPLGMVERIEVAKPATPIVWGPGGPGGAVNIITRTPELTPLIEFTAEGSPVHEIRGSVAHAFDIGPFSYSVYGGFDDRADWPLSAGYTATATQSAGDRIGSERLSGYGGGKIEAKINDDHTLVLSGHVTGGNYFVPPSTVSPRPRFWRFDPWMAATAQLAHRGRYAGESVEVIEALFVSPFSNTLRSYDNANYNTQTAPGSFTSFYDDMAAGGYVRARGRIEPGLIQALDLRLWAGGRFENHTESTAGLAGDTEYSHWLLTAAPQVDTIFTDWITLIAGAQIDAEVPDSFAGVVEPKNQITAGPFASVAISPADFVDVELSAAQRARFPTLKERFADAFGQRVPNPGLGAEKAWNFSLDVTARLPAGVGVAVSAFDSEISGLIVREALGAGQYRLENAGSARLAGAEAVVTWVNEEWGIDAYAGYQYLWARRTDAAFPEDQLEYRPEHKAYAKLGWTFLDRFTLTNEAIITGPRPYLDLDTGTWGRLATSSTWNVRLEGEVLKWMKLWVAATNVLDSSEQSEFGFPDPGRQVWAGLRITDNTSTRDR